MHRGGRRARRKRPDVPVEPARVVDAGSHAGPPRGRDDVPDEITSRAAGDGVSVIGAPVDEDLEPVAGEPLGGGPPREDAEAPIGHVPASFSRRSPGDLACRLHRSRPREGAPTGPTASRRQSPGYRGGRSRSASMPPSSVGRSLIQLGNGDRTVQPSVTSQPRVGHPSRVQRWTWPSITEHPPSAADWSTGGPPPWRSPPTPRAPGTPRRTRTAQPSARRSRGLPRAGASPEPPGTR